MNSPTYIAVVALVGLLIGLSKGGMGAVLVVLTTPLLTLVMPVQEAISLALPLLLIADVFALWIYWKQWDERYIRLMLPAAVIGVAVGTVLLWALPDLTLRRILGIFTLTFVIYRLFSEQIQRMQIETKPWHGVAAGAASGLGSALANTGAPPFTAYMLLQGVSPLVFAGTTTLFFAVVNLLKLPGLIITGLMDFNKVAQTVWVLPAIPLGVWLGRWMVARINRYLFERILLALLFLASLILLFS